MRRDEVDATASPAPAPDTAVAVAGSPDAQDHDASPPPPVAPRSAHQVSDLAHTMAVLEPVLRASAPPPVVFSVDSTTDEVMAAVGPRELELVIVPLVDRAAASVADGGTIRVVVGRGPCSASRDADWALVVVADNGPGEADPSIRPDLDSVRDAVAALGGHLDVTSVARHGTTVTVALPLVETTETTETTEPGEPTETDDECGAVTSR